MRHPYSRRLHGRALNIVAVYAVRHNGIFAEKPGLFIGLVIPFAVRTKRAHHGYLLKIFAQMRLRAKFIFRTERAKPCHQLIRTAWREARRYYGPYAAEAGKRFHDKAAFFAQRALGCFAQLIGGVPGPCLFCPRSRICPRVQAPPSAQGLRPYARRKTRKRALCRAR